MASRTNINIHGYYFESINAMLFHICTLNSKKLKGRTESYLIPVLFLNLNDYQTRFFNFGLRLRIHPNGCKLDKINSNL